MTRCSRHSRPARTTSSRSRSGSTSSSPGSGPTCGRGARGPTRSRASCAPGRTSSARSATWRCRPSPDDAAAALVTELGRSAGCEFVGVLQMADRGRLNVLATYNGAAGVQRGGAPRGGSSPVPDVTRAATARGSRSSDRRLHDDSTNAFWSAGLELAAGAPIYAGTRVVGVLITGQAGMDPSTTPARQAKLLASVIDYANILSVAAGASIAHHRRTTATRARLERVHRDAGVLRGLPADRRTHRPSDHRVRGAHPVHRRDAAGRAVRRGRPSTAWAWSSRRPRSNRRSQAAAAPAGAGPDQPQRATRPRARSRAGEVVHGDRAAADHPRADRARPDRGLRRPARAPSSRTARASASRSTTPGPAMPASATSWSCARRS